MTQQKLRNQELNRHEENVDRSVEKHLATNLDEKYYVDLGNCGMVAG